VVVVLEDALQAVGPPRQEVEPRRRREAPGQVIGAVEVEELSLHGLQPPVRQGPLGQPAKGVVQVEVSEPAKGWLDPCDTHLVLEPVAVEGLAEEGDHPWRGAEPLGHAWRDSYVHARVHLGVHELDGGHGPVQRELLVLHHAADG